MAFADWCDEEEHDVGTHKLGLLEGRAAHLHIGLDALAEVVPTHYASEERIAGLLARLGKPKAAQFVRDKLPETKNIRSGDLGEIIATEYVNERADFAVPIKRLRWKDHRDMAMRGDDIIGVRFPENPNEPAILFMKGETKSRKALPGRVLAEARTSLERDNGLPSPHALTYVADRLREQGNIALADAIDKAQLVDAISENQVSHLLFVFCGNNPEALMRASLGGYLGRIPQQYVGLRVATHQEFIEEVYLKVIENGDNV